jgi:hypothetical protein
LPSSCLILTCSRTKNVTTASIRTTSSSAVLHDPRFFALSTSCLTPFTWFSIFTIISPCYK